MKVGYRENLRRSAVALCLLAAVAFAGPDSYLPEKMLWNGQQPYLAMDYQRNVLHMAYLNGAQDAIEYRTGTVNGNFGQPETPFPMKMVSPRIRLDKNGVPHMVAATNMWLGSNAIYYTNRIGGTWMTPVKVMDGASDGTANTINPYLCVGPDNRAYVSCQSSHNGSVTGALFRVDNINTSPTVTKKTKGAELLITILFFKGNELWGVGGSPLKAGGRWFSRFDTETLKPVKKINAKFSGRGEGLGASMDHTGDIHAGGISTGKSGTYTRLSWARSGGKVITFKSTNGHENGSVVPIRDRVAKDRVYVFYWNGGTDGAPTNPNVIKDCAPRNQLRFFRVENGKKANDNKPVTDLPNPHGRSGRTPPAVAAHPNGGVLVVHEQCPKPEEVEGSDKTLEFTTLGRRLVFTIVGDSKVSVPALSLTKSSNGQRSLRPSLLVTARGHLPEATGLYTVHGRQCVRMPSNGLVLIANGHGRKGGINEK